MQERIEVVYENGLLRPLAPLPGRFVEQQHLIVLLETDGPGQEPNWLADADPTASLDAVRRVLAPMPGTFAEAVQAEREER